MRNLFRLLRGKPVELSPKQKEKMAQMAEREAAGAKARAEYEAFMTSQGLPVQPMAAQPTSIRDALEYTAGQFRELAESGFDDRRAILDPGPDADLNHPP